MSESISKNRERAEAAFSLTQTQHLSRSRAVSEIDAVTAARDEKTARLRALRLEQDAATLAKIASQSGPTRICQGKVEPVSPEKTNENKKV